MNVYLPNAEELEFARKTFETNEPRDLFYRAATELVELSIRGITSLTLAEALAVLLQTWNRAYYQYHPFDAKHFREIENLIDSHKQTFMRFRLRAVESFCDEDRKDVQVMFQQFEIILGPVGAAKCLHLLCPRFFPLWDRAIARSYHLPLGQAGTNDIRYCRFMEVSQNQIESLGGEDKVGRNPLKAIDEYNYCRFTKNWI